MIPFVEPPSVQIGPLTLQAFGLVVALAVLTSFALARRRFGRLGLDAAVWEHMASWLLVGGFAGAHLFAVLLYFPGLIPADPWLLLRFWEHISSFGGMLGAAAAMGLYFWLRARYLGPRQRWAYVDGVVFVFAFALMIGRSGCALVSDHPGQITDFPLAVSLETEPARDLIAGAYAAAGRVADLPPPDVLASLGFHDLGLYEMLYLGLVVVPVLLLLDRKARQPGFFTCAFVALYMPVRFGLDFLRIGDARYAGLTPAQWTALVVVVALPVMWRYVRPQAVWTSEQGISQQPRAA